MTSDVEDPRGDLTWSSLPDLVRDAAARFGEAPAVVDRYGPNGSTTTLSWVGLADAVESATRSLLAHGIDRGDRVAIWAPNCAEWIVAALGAVGAGALLVPLNTRYKGTEASYVLRESGARVLFTVEGFLGLDFPAMLRASEDQGEPLRDLEQIVVMRTEDGGDVAAAGADRNYAVASREAFLEEGSCISADVVAGRMAAPLANRTRTVATGMQGEKPGWAADSSDAIEIPGSPRIPMRE